MEKLLIKVTGMSCQHCVNAVSGAVKALDGVADVTVDLDGGTAAVIYDTGRVTPDKIKAAIEEEGYGAE